MPSLQDMEQALMAADKAGDAESAKAIAADMQSMMNNGPAAQTGPAPNNMPANPYQVAARFVLPTAPGFVQNYVGDTVNRDISGIKQLLNPVTYQKVWSGLTDPNQFDAAGRLKPEVRQELNDAAMKIGLSVGILPTSMSAATRAALTNVRPAANTALANLADKIGYPLTPAERTGNKVLQQLEAGAESFPLTSGVFNKVQGGRQELAGKIAAKSIGENANAVTSDVLNSASDRIGLEFDRLTSSVVKVPVSQDATQKLSALMAEKEGLTTSPLESNVLFKKVLDAITGKNEIPGDQYQSLVSKLGNRAASEMRSPGGDRDLGDALFKTKNILDDMAASAMSPQDQAAFATARQQYRNLITLLKPNVLNETTGKVNVAALGRTLAKQDKAGFRLGQNENDLYTLGRIGRSAEQLANSGTATRAAYPILGATLGNSVASAARGDVSGAVKGPLEALVPWLLAKAYMSPMSQRLMIGPTAPSTTLPRYLMSRGLLAADAQNQGLLGQ